MNREVLLVGNPNSGKTTLFNMLTKSNEHTGNWHGVTVDKKYKKFIDSEYVLIDLPGTYSLNAYTFEEKITSEECVFTNKKIINIIDFNCLQRGLNLTLQLIEMGKDFVVVLNPIKSKKNSIDINKLKTFINKDILVFSKIKAIFLPTRSLCNTPFFFCALSSAAKSIR